MNLPDMIPETTKNVVRLLAEQGKPADTIGLMTHLDVAAVEEILAGQADGMAKDGASWPVNSTSET